MIHAHIIPALGPHRLRDLKRPTLRKFLASRLEVALKPRTVQALGLLLTAIFDEAIEDGLLSTNPAAKLGKRMNLARLDKALPEKTIAFRSTTS